MIAVRRPRREVNGATGSFPPTTPPRAAHLVPPPAARRCRSGRRGPRGFFNTLRFANGGRRRVWVRLRVGFAHAQGDRKKETAMTRCTLLSLLLAASLACPGCATLAAEE